MGRRPAGMAALGVLLLAFLGSQSAAQDKKTDYIKLSTLEPKLFREIVQTYIERYYKGKGDKAREVKDLEILGPLETLAERLTYSYKDGKPQIKCDCSKIGKRPDNFTAGQDALKGLLRFMVEQMVKEPIQVGKDSPGYAVKKEEEKAIADGLLGAVEFIWAETPPPPPPPSDELKKILAQLKDLTDRVDALTKDVTALKDAAPRINEVVKDIASLRTAIDVLQKRADSSDTAVKELTGRVSTLETTLKSLDERLKKVESGSGGGGGIGGGGTPGFSTTYSQQCVWYLVPGYRFTCGGYLAPSYSWVPVLQAVPRVAVAAGPRRQTTSAVASARGEASKTDRGEVSLVRDGGRGESLGAPTRASIRPLRLEGLKAADAQEMFWYGNRLYWQRDYEAAWKQFDAATRLADNDARFWYFKALTELALGDEKAARTSRKRGAELQAQALPNPDLIGKALERIQGGHRAWLRRGVDSVESN